VKEETERRQKKGVRDEEGLKEIKMKEAVDTERTTDYTCNHDSLNPAQFQGPCSQTTLHFKPCF
jgi:hypothetical protein